MYNSCINYEKVTTVIKSKIELSVETSYAISLFIQRGGVIELGKPRRTPKMIMRGKSSRSGSTGTSGFAVGFPTKSFV